MEQQLPAGLGEREIAEFIENDDVEASEIVGDASLSAGSTFGLKLIDEIDGGEEAPARSGADATPRDGDGQMRLACAGRTSVILPGVRRLKSGSRIGFTRARVISLRWSASGGMQAPITSLSGSPITPWRCCRRG
jgi:hypothetical protein